MNSENDQRMTKNSATSPTGAPINFKVDFMSNEAEASLANNVEIGARGRGRGIAKTNLKIIEKKKIVIPDNSSQLWYLQSSWD